MSVDDDQAAGEWEASWEVEFPAATAAELLVALLVRDQLHGSSFDLELESGEVMEVDFAAGDELDESAYTLLACAAARGPQDRSALQQLVEEVLEQLVAEAEDLARSCQLLGSVASDELGFEPVEEHDERWDLVVPDWLAPDGAEVPFGFRPVLARTGARWPDDSLLDSHSRVVLVPHGGLARLFGVPAATGDEVTPEEARALPVVP
jgi:hypothetical protein